MPEKFKREPWKEVLLSLCYLGFWCHLGVLSRVYLDRLVSIGCSPSSWGPCFVGTGKEGNLYGLYTSVMVSNILGCLFMGMLTPAVFLDLGDEETQVSSLPRGSSWQSNNIMLLGLRTGYCGCLTTFASWVVGEVLVGINDNRYFDMVWGLVIGYLTSMAGFMVGEDIAVYLHRAYNGKRFALWLQAPLKDVESVIAQIEEVDREGYAEDVNETVLERMTVDAPLNGADSQGGATSSPANGSELRRRKLPPSSSPPPAATAVAAASKDDAATAAAGGADEERGGGGAGQGPGQRGAGAVDSSSQPKGGSGWADTGAVVDAAEACSASISRWTGGVCSNRTDVAHIVLFATTSALFISLLAAYDNAAHAHRDTRTWFFAIVAGPPGCYIRWQLARFNFRGSGFWKYFPSGTFAANMLGCAIDYGLQIILQRADNLGYWGNVVVTGTQLGFCGSMTTVSTWIFEVRKQLKLVKEGIWMGHFYMLVSLTTACLLGFVIYGWAYWVA